jgi:hypothetical protein
MFCFETTFLPTLKFRKMPGCYPGTHTLVIQSLQSAAPPLLLDTVLFWTCALPGHDSETGSACLKFTALCRRLRSAATFTQNGGPCRRRSDADIWKRATATECAAVVRAAPASHKRRSQRQRFVSARRQTASPWPSSSGNRLLRALLRCDACRRKKTHSREANHGLTRSSGGGEAPRRSGSRILQMPPELDRDPTISKVPSIFCIYPPFGSRLVITIRLFYEMTLLIS